MKSNLSNRHNCCNMWLLMREVRSQSQQCPTSTGAKIINKWSENVLSTSVVLLIATLVITCTTSTTIATKESAEDLTGTLAEETRRLSAETTTGGSPNHLFNEKRLFSVELLRALHEQYATVQVVDSAAKKEDRQQVALINRQQSMNLLLNALGAEGDMRRLVDWLQNSFNLASVGELTTQFVVSKLGSVNCAALLKPDAEEKLVPRFLLFNEHFVDVPFELPGRGPTSVECLEHGRFDPERKTVVLIHGYLAGYTLVDGLTNIKNRLLDINKHVIDRVASATMSFSPGSTARNSSANHLFDDAELERKVKSQMYNVIIVDWFNGANPVPRARYIRAATNAQVVGKLIAKFLLTLVDRCRTPANNIEIIAHSLGCHVAGFTGKAMQTGGHILGRITHLDPVGLCFGRLFSEPQFRLSPTDAIETRAVHVSLNLFDNPLDGAQVNFLVNGGRDQIGCTGNELQNSTTSSVSLLFDSQAKFTPCSHLRAFALFEDDHSSSINQCQLVGYRCSSYDRFLAGKCGHCDVANNQCRLMSLPPVVPLKQMSSEQQQQQPQSQPQKYNSKLINLVREISSNGSIAWVIDDKELNQQIGDTVAKMKPNLKMAELNSGKSHLAAIPMTGKSHKAAQQQVAATSTSPPSQQSKDLSDENYAEEYPKPPVAPTGNEIRRFDRKLSSEHREKLAQTIDKIRAETRHVLSEGWTNLKTGAAAAGETKLKVSSLINKSPFHHSLTMASPMSLIEAAPTVVSIGHLQQQAPPVELHKGSQPPPVVEPPPPVQVAPLGSQALPAGSVNGPLFFLGTGPLSPHCVNYYQFRMLVAEARVNRLLASAGGGVNGNKQQVRNQRGLLNQRQQVSIGGDSAQSGGGISQTGGDKLHLTVKLSDSNGHFFKGFTLTEDTKSLSRVPIVSERQKAIVQSENMIELTMLLNTTQALPVKVSESIVSYYFHKILLADYIEVNFMSNISPE